MNQRILGVDIGGVIIDRAYDNTDTSFFSDKYLETPPVKGAFEGLRRLNVLFSGRVYLVSKCSEKTERKTRDWLKARDFYSATGIPENNLRFCRYREAKKPMCEELGITDFIDDRLDVLEYLRETVPSLYLFGQQDAPSGIIAVENWDEVLKRIKI